MLCCFVLCCGDDTSKQNKTSIKSAYLVSGVRKHVLRTKCCPPDIIVGTTGILIRERLYNNDDDCKNKKQPKNVDETTNNQPPHYCRTIYIDPTNNIIIS